MTLKKPFAVTIVTLFPEAFPGLLGMSVLGRGLREGLWELRVVNLREYGEGKHRTVDDTPYGGGAGMVLKPDVVAAALRGAKSPGTGHQAPGEVAALPRTLYMGPAGRRFVQADARRLAAEECGIVILCGHYEGVDERVLEAEVDEVVSVGDFVLSGGENAAMVVVDAVVRLLPGVLGGDASLHEESFDIVDEVGVPLVEYPHYTRPVAWEGRAVPEVLTKGNHAEIKAWRMGQAKERTARAKG